MLVIEQENQHRRKEEQAGGKSPDEMRKIEEYLKNCLINHKS